MNNPEELQHFLDVLLKESNFTRAAKELYFPALFNAANWTN